MGTGRGSPVVILGACTGAAEPQGRFKFTDDQPCLEGALFLLVRLKGGLLEGQNRPFFKCDVSSTQATHKLACIRRKHFFARQGSTAWHLTPSPASASWVCCDCGQLAPH